VARSDDRPPPPAHQHARRRQHVQAIDLLAQEISGPARPAAEEAALVARRLAWALGELEREMAEMARHADQGEVRRLEQRLAGLGAESSGETAETTELRRLIERQLDLLRPMGDRVEAARARRGRLRGLLSQLHGELAQVRQAIDQHLDAWREPAARLGAVCHEAAALVEETRAAETMATRTR
jgi:DNA repair exonuclease SbcCD ATPase subunit